MAKLIKFDLIIDGNKVKTFEELQDNLHADLLPYLKNGKLAKWFLSRDLADKAAAIAAIDLNQPDLALLSAVCEVLELEADDDILQEILDTADKLAVAIPAVSTNDTDSNIEAETSESTTTGYREDWSGRDLSGRSFQGDDLSRYNFAGANLSSCNFSEANLEGANFEGADLSSAQFKGANLRYANLKAVDISNADFSSQTSIGYAVKLTDMSYADLSNACAFKHVWFCYANLAHTIFKNVDLNTEQSTNGPSFDKATLVNTDFSNANLQRGSFKKATLTNVNFSFANISHTHSEEAVLDNVKFTGVIKDNCWGVLK